MTLTQSCRAATKNVSGQAHYQEQSVGMRWGAGGGGGGGVGLQNWTQRKLCRKR